MRKAARQSAGLLMFRIRETVPEFLLAHPGGPFFRDRQDGWWTIPKGLPNAEESLLQTAIREFEEETGLVSSPPYLPLGEVRQKGGKVVHAWAFQGEWQPALGFRCNTFRMEWPPRSGRFQSFPEIDQLSWMDREEALLKINEAQSAFIYRLLEHLENNG